MSRYFFHLTHSEEIRDEAGVELASLQEAKCHAVKMIADVLCEHPNKFWHAETYRVTVSDSAGLVLLSVEMISLLAPVLMPTHVKQSEA
jgi:hypothetical protein